MKMIISVLTLLVTSASWSAECPKRFDPSEAYVGWTAYKTTDKVGVDGRFLKTEFKGNSQGPTVAKILRGLRVSVDVSSVETDKPARNATILQGFFKNLADGMKVVGSVEKVSGTDEKGTFVLDLRINGKTQAVPMSYSVNEAKQFEATGEIDILKFGARKAFGALHELCKELHKGKDGVSKTWSDVKIVLRAPVHSSCG